MKKPELPPLLLLFDGHCRLCSGLVQFVLKNDPEGKIKMAPLQSGEGKAMLEKTGHSELLPDSLVFIKEGKILLEAEAALQLGRELRPFRLLANLAGLLPLFILNPAYRLLAKNRYRLWGKTENCFLPGPEWKNRFLDGSLH